MRWRKWEEEMNILARPNLLFIVLFHVNRKLRAVKLAYFEPRTFYSNFHIFETQTPIYIHSLCFLYAVAH